MHSRLAATIAAGVLAITGLATGTAHAATTPKPSVTVADACAPLSLHNPTRWGAQFAYRVVGHRTAGPVNVPARSTVQRSLRPRYGSGALSVQWWARSHDWRAKAKAVVSAERARRLADEAQGTAQAAFDVALGKVNEYKASNSDVVLPLTQAEVDRLTVRLGEIVNDDALKADVQARLDALKPYLAAEKSLAEAKVKAADARTELSRVKAAVYWTRWDRGLVRVPACVTPTPTPTPTVTVEPTPTPTPTPDPTDPPADPTEEPEPEPVPTVTQTNTRTIVINRIPVPARVDTGLGGLARR